MQNLNAATRLQPRLMNVVLSAMKELDRKGIEARIIVEKGVDFRAKIVKVEKGKSIESKEVNAVLKEKAQLKEKWGISFDGEFLRIDSIGAIKEEKEFVPVDLSENNNTEENSGVESEETTEINLKKKKKK